MILVAFYMRASSYLGTGSREFKALRFGFQMHMLSLSLKLMDGCSHIDMYGHFYN